MPRHPAEAEKPQENAPMEQVRELLFGAQLKDMETRIRRQEERFLREIADARDAFKARLDTLENFMKSENAALAARLREEENEREHGLKTEQRERAEALKTEQRERTEALKAEQRERAEAFAQAGRELASAIEGLERKLAKLANTLDESERELRRLLLAESGKLTENTEEKYQDALNVLANTAAQIRHDMVHRSSLASMFTETAVKLSGQWTPELDAALSSGRSPQALDRGDDSGQGDA